MKKVMFLILLNVLGISNSQCQRRLFLDYAGDDYQNEKYLLDGNGTKYLMASSEREVTSETRVFSWRQTDLPKASTTFPNIQILIILPDWVKCDNLEVFARKFPNVHTICIREPGNSDLSNFRSFKKLRHLSLLLFRELKINEILVNLKSLEIVVDSNLTITNGAFPKLEKLRITSPNIPKEIEDCTAVRDLFIAGIFTDFPPDISKMKHLDSLCFDQAYKLPYFPKSIFGCQNLSKLILRGAFESSLPEGIGNLVKLRELELCGNEPLELPSNFSKLEKLEKLAIISQVTEFPKNFSRLINLRYLILGNKRNIDELLPEIGELRNLEELNISNSYIPILPDNFKNLKKLRKFNASSNRLFRLDDGFFDLTLLEELDLSSNSLLRIPANIGNLQNLKVLSLNTNELQTIPNEISNLKKLKHLNLDGNRILHYSPWLPKLPQLESLKIDGGLNEPLNDTIFKDFRSLKKLSLSCFNDYVGKKPLNIFQNKSLEVLEMPFYSYKPDGTEFCELKHLKTLRFASEEKLVGLQDKLKICHPYCEYFEFTTALSPVEFSYVPEDIPDDSKVVAIRKLLISHPKNLEYTTRLVSCINEYVIELINYGCPKLAKLEIEDGLKYDPTNHSLIKNYVHALFFSGNIEEATTEYFRLKDLPFSSTYYPERKFKTYKAVFIHDLRSIQQDGDNDKSFNVKIDEIIKLLKQ